MYFYWIITIMFASDSVSKKALTNDEIKKLIKACPSEIWKIRILLSLCTGIRKNDIDNLPDSAINLKLATLSYTAKKTGKVSMNTPLPKALIPALKKYLKDKPKASTKLLPDNNIRKTWDLIKTVSGVNCTRHDFRVTFSTLMQKYSGIDIAKELLQHSSSKVTENHYSDKELLMRLRIEKLPVREWLKP